MYKSDATKMWVIPIASFLCLTSSLKMRSLCYMGVHIHCANVHHLRNISCAEVRLCILCTEMIRRPDIFLRVHILSRKNIYLALGSIFHLLAQLGLAFYIMSLGGSSLGLFSLPQHQACLLTVLQAFFKGPQDTSIHFKVRDLNVSTLQSLEEAQYVS